MFPISQHYKLNTFSLSWIIISKVFRKEKQAATRHTRLPRLEFLNEFPNDLVWTAESAVDQSSDISTQNRRLMKRKTERIFFFDFSSADASTKIIFGLLKLWFTNEVDCTITYFNTWNISINCIRFYFVFCKLSKPMEFRVVFKRQQF